MAYKTASDLTLKQIKSLQLEVPKQKPQLPRQVYETRLQKLVDRMEQSGLDAVVIYGDREHYHNLKYFVGFDPRFEEALLVIHRDKRMFAALGNECLPLTVNSQLPLTGVLCQSLSLPSQPMDDYVSMEKTFEECGLKAGMHTGAIDWKLMTPAHGANYRSISGMPAYIFSALVAVCGGSQLVSNQTDLLINPADGIRTSYGADEIAEFEYGAAVASQAVLDMIAGMRPGMTEKEAANLANGYGLPPTCHTMLCSGDNIDRGLISPTDRVLQLGDEISMCYALEGGLTCRHAVLAKDENDLSYSGQYFIDEIVKPYIATVFNWYEMLQVGTLGGDIYNMVQSTFPKEKYGWTLNPGHLGGTEEWLSSPVYPGSTATIQNGTLIQMDIIPSAPGYCSPNDEDSAVVANEGLRAELAAKYPAVYARIMARREFMQTQLGLTLHPDVLPLSNLAGEYNPYLLSRGLAIALK